MDIDRIETFLEEIDWDEFLNENRKRSSWIFFLAPSRSGLAIRLHPRDYVKCQGVKVLITSGNAVFSKRECFITRENVQLKTRTAIKRAIKDAIEETHSIERDLGALMLQLTEQKRRQHPD